MKVQLLFEEYNILTKSKIPERWKRMPLVDMIHKGWKPRIKAKGDKSYISMRHGNQERGLGPYTEERWNFLHACTREISNVISIEIQGPPKQVNDIVMGIRKRIKDAKDWLPTSTISQFVIPVKEAEKMERKRIWEGYQEK